MPQNHARRQRDAQGVVGICLLARPRGIRFAGVPEKRHTVIIVSVVGVAFPMTRQPDRVRQIFKAAVANQLGMQPALDPFIHEFYELTIEQRTDLAFHFARVYRNSRGKRIAGAARRQSGSANRHCKTQNSDWTPIFHIDLAGSKLKKLAPLRKRKIAASLRNGQFNEAWRSALNLSALSRRLNWLLIARCAARSSIVSNESS
jgi:hypothetical protein